jgi:hypothetical protein
MVFGYWVSNQISPLPETFSFPTSTNTMNNKNFGTSTPVSNGDSNPHPIFT